MPPRYEADTHRCPGCAEKERFEKAHYSKGTPVGVSVVLRRLTAEQQREYAADAHNGPARIPD